MKWLLLVALAGCGTPPPEWLPDAGTCVGYVVPAGMDLTTPARSFTVSVMNVLNDHCGSGMCHGSSDNPTGGVFLGSSGAMGADAADAYAAIVGKPSGELPSMNLVTAGDPARSYLMHKLDGDQCQFELMCASPGCQHSMPNDLAVLIPVTERDIVREWIAQGAPNN
jgi:hypothetical protein